MGFADRVKKVREKQRRLSRLASVPRRGAGIIDDIRLLPEYPEDGTAEEKREFITRLGEMLPESNRYDPVREIAARQVGMSYGAVYVGGTDGVKSYEISTRRGGGFIEGADLRRYREERDGWREAQKDLP